jgi:LacI family transcriptional regulator
MRVRLKDIAADLNLSKMTISKVLRGQTDISEATRARVLKRVKELKYIPNLSASSLRTGQTRTIGLILPSMAKQFLAGIAAGISRTVSSSGYSLVICLSNEDAESEQRQVENLVSLQVDALLIVSCQETAAYFEQMPGTRRMPIIFMQQMPAGIRESYVGVQEEEVGWLAADHLAGTGCKRIAYLRGPRTAVGDLRASGYRRALSENGLGMPAGLLIDFMADESDYSHGRDAMERLLALRARPDGIMTYTDLMAVGAMDAAASHGVRIPEEMRVVGCGDDPAVCTMKIPLTSIDTGESEIGERAGRMAVRSIAKNKGKATQTMLVKPRLVRRQSSRTTR